MNLKTRIIRIGNSQGIRIPKPLLEQSGISGEVELEADNGRIVIHSTTKARSGWAAAMSAMAENGDDYLLDPETAGPEWDSDEWQWD